MTPAQLLLLGNGRTRDRSTLGAWLSGIFGLDLRSLALYRIGMGVMLLADLILRSRDLLVHYTDDGILPRHVNVYRPSQLMFHQLSGSAWYEAMLFIIAGLFALLMLVGCWTRVATCVSWLLLASLQARNPLTNDGGQDLMRLLMFWNMFLPLGARYSVDAALSLPVERTRPMSVAAILRNLVRTSMFWNICAVLFTSAATKPSLHRRTRVVSVATFALMVQLCAMYWISSRFKTSPEWLHEGSAVYYALSIDMLATPIGVWLRQFPVFLRGLTYFVVLLERFTPLLCFFPWPNPLFRIALILLACGMHVGFIACMWIELFPFLCIVAWMALLPTVVWDGLDNWLKSPRRKGLALYYDPTGPWARRWALLARTFCILPRMPIRRLTVNPELAELARQRCRLVLSDAQGHRYFGFAALAQLMVRSPVVWPLGWLFMKFASASLPPRKEGAPRKGRLDWLAKLLPMRPLWSPPWGLKLAGWLSIQAFVAVWVVYTIGYNLETVGIRAIDFGAIPQMVQQPTTIPSAMLSTGNPPRDYQWNFSAWMNRALIDYKVITIGDFKFVLPQTFRKMGLELRLDQYWSMFAPKPLDTDGWFVLSGRLEDKTTIDMWTLKPVTFERPKWPANKFPNYRWFKFMEKFLRYDASQRGFHECIGNYYLRSWDRAHPNNHLIELNVYFVTEMKRPPYMPRTQEVVLVMKWCRNNQCK